MSENNLRKKAKALTARIHKYVETLPIMREIMSSELDPKRYLKYLIQIRAIYNAIESNKIYKELGWNLFLTENYKCDIDSIKSRFNILDEKYLEITDIYCSHLTYIKNKDSMAGHAYVRYMAELFGGSFMKKKLSNKFPVNAYNINRKYIKLITEYINNNIENEELFISEVRNAFMSHAAILEMI